MKSRVGVTVVLAVAWGCATGSANDDGSSGAAGGTFASAPTFAGDAEVACTNLQCRQDKCANGAKTRLSAHVFDPAGQNALYNVIVYVPNAPLEPLAPGVTCDRCGSVLSGSPIATALTDTNGKFVLDDVPSGDFVPLVIQVGKWRRQITLPRITACADNPMENPDLFRLPKNHLEGDMPRIAISTGCDPMECLLRKIGIADTEFTPGDGAGSVHVYRGVGGGGVDGSTDAYAFWSSLDNLKKYDVVINACECKPYPRGDGAYGAMQRYLDMGGRFFGSHYHYNWFTDQPNQSDQAVDWTPGGACNAGPNLIDTTFPKGRAMSDWLMQAGASDKPGTIPLSCAPLDVAGTKNKLAQGWIYDGPTGAPSYVSFNTPIDAASAQCGRAVFADLHVSSPHGDFAGMPFPEGCRSTQLSPQEKALEFMFFDLASCVMDDSAQPTAPPIK